MTTVVVIGASAAGLMTALKTSVGGIKTVLLEANLKIGISPADTLIDSMIKKCEINIFKKSIIHKVKGFRIISPSGICLEFNSPGYKIDREIFDENLLSQIKKNGGEIHLGTKVTQFKHASDGKSTIIAIKNGKKVEFSFDILVIASGSFNPWLKDFLPMKYPNDVAYSYQVDMEDIDIDPDYFEFYLGHKYAPGWKAAISPFSKSKGSIGIYARGIKPGDEEKYFKNFISIPSVNSKLKDGKIVQTYFGLDPIATIPNQLVYHNIVVVGCAGGQSGLAYGIAAGDIAGETIIDSKGDISYLKNYEQYWKHNFMKDYIMGRLALQLIYRLSDDDINSLFEILSENRFDKKDISFIEVLKMCIFLLKRYPKLFFRVISITLQNILM